MKKSKVLLVVITFILTSCSSSDSSSISSTSSIVGKWRLVSSDGVAISECVGLFPNLVLNANSIGTEGKGFVVDPVNPNECVYSIRDIQFNVTQNILFTKEINKVPSDYVYEDKRTIFINGNTLKLKVFYIKRRLTDGSIETTNIPQEEQIEETYEKVN